VAATADVLAAAFNALSAGLSVIPIREDGTKSPSEKWRRWQSELPSRQHLTRWFSSGLAGMATVCGRISGNLELFEFEDCETYQAFNELAANTGLADLVDRIEAGYLEQSPGGGIHWLLHCSVISGNTVLARRPKRPDEILGPQDKLKVLIETRGEGGYAIVAPSAGRVHPSGKPYVLLQGNPASIARIEAEEREALWELARSFDQAPKRNFDGARFLGRANGEGRPGDEFNQHTSWDDVLLPHGWEPAWTSGETTYWRRPGKQHGISATTNYRGSDLFYCFSTSTVFEANRGYNRFSSFALLNHGGDFRAAAAALRQAGLSQTPDPAELPQIVTNNRPLRTAGRRLGRAGVNLRSHACKRKPRIVGGSLLPHRLGCLLFTNRVTTSTQIPFRLDERCDGNGARPIRFLHSD